MNRRQVIGTVILTVLASLLILPFVAHFWISSAHDDFDFRASQLIPGISKADVIRIIGQPAFVDTTANGTEIWAFRPPRWLFAEWPECYFLAGDSIMSEFWREPVHLTLQSGNVSE